MPSGPSLEQPFLYLGTFAGADGVDVVNVTIVRQGLGNPHTGIRQEDVITRCGRAARLGPCLQVSQLDAKHGTLNALQAIVVTLQHVLILGLSAPVAQHADGPRILVLAGYDHPPSP